MITRSPRRPGASPGASHGPSHGPSRGRSHGASRGPARPGPARPGPTPWGLARWGHRPGWRGTLALVALLGIGGLLGWVVLGSNLLAIRTVDVTGVSRLTPAQVRAAGRVPLGTSLAAVDTGEIRGRVAALRPVARVAVSRRWPRTVRIAVVERRAVVAVAQGAGVALLDHRGVPFATAAQRPAGVVALRVANPGPGDPATQAALDVLAALPGPVRARVAEVAADSPQAVTLRLQGGATVVWGDPGRSARKAQVLAALLARPAAQYDVSAPDVPTTR